MCAVVLAVGCAAADSEARSAEQAQLEAEFGPRADAQAPVGGGAATEPERPVAPTPGGSRAVPDREMRPNTAPRPSTTPATDAPPPFESESVSEPVSEPVTGPPAPPSESASGVDVSGSGADVDSLLAAAEVAYDKITSLRAAFVQRMEIPLLDRVSEGAGTWYQRGSGHFRMEFAEPAGDVLVADGTYFWAYQPSQQPDQVIKSRLGGGAEAGTVDVLGQILSEARTRYTSVDEGVESVSGVSTRVITLTPLGASRYRSVRVWIADTDALVRRFRIEEENETIRTVTLSSLEPQVPLDDALFQFTAPPGVQTFEG